MKIKEFKIRWHTVEPATDCPVECEVTFEPLFRSLEKTQEEAMKAVRAAIIAEGAQFDPALIEEVK